MYWGRTIAVALIGVLFLIALFLLSGGDGQVKNVGSNESFRDFSVDICKQKAMEKVEDYLIYASNIDDKKVNVIYKEEFDKCMKDYEEWDR